MTHRLRRGSQAADGNGTKEKGFRQREKEQQKQQQPHQVEEDQSRSMRVFLDGAEVRQAPTVAEGVAQHRTHNMTCTAEGRRGLNRTSTVGGVVVP